MGGSSVTPIFILPILLAFVTPGEIRNKLFSLLCIIANFYFDEIVGILNVIIYVLVLVGWLVGWLVYSISSLLFNAKSIFM